MCVIASDLLLYADNIEVISLGGTATEEDGELIERLFGAIGKAWRANEKLFDAVTGLRYV